MKWLRYALLSSLLCVCIGQAICFFAAVLGEREDRIYLMGTFALSPIAILLCLATGLTVSLQPETDRSRRFYICSLVAIFVLQLAMLLWG